MRFDKPNFGEVVKAIGIETKRSFLSRKFEIFQLSENFGNSTIGDGRLEVIQNFIDGKWKMFRMHDLEIIYASKGKKIRIDLRDIYIYI